MSTREKISKVLKIVLRAMAVALFIVSLSGLYTMFAIDKQQVLPDQMNITITLLRAFTITAVGLGVLTPWLGGKNTKVTFAVLAIIVGIFNLILFNENMIAWGYGRPSFSHDYGYAYTPWRIYGWIIEQIMLIVMGLISFVKSILDKDFIKLNPFYILATLIVLPLLYMPPSTVQNLNTILRFTTSKESAKDFSTPHLLLLAGNFVLFFVLFFTLRKKDMATKRLVFSLCALAPLYNFFNVGLYSSAYGFSYGSLPFHLCNTAVILIFVAYAFNVKQVYYFSFFVNVIGCLFAMLFPNYGDEVYWYTYSTFRFWVNHIFAFTLPLAGMALGVFERPKFKSMLYALGIFTAYFVLVIWLNTWFSNFSSVNYFFINDNFFFEKLNIGSGLKDNYTVDFTIGVYSFTMFPLFYLCVYAVFVALMFVTWYIYDFFFKVVDSHKQLHVKKLLIKQGYLDFKKELNGRSIHEPLVLEAKGMIEIKNFTKVYSGSDKPSVDNLNLTIKDGEVYGFLGHNGAGKSTTIKSLVGIQTITSGQMIVDGYDVTKQPVEAKLRIGYVSDNHAVYEKLTGREYINYIADLYMVNQKDRDERIEKYTKMFHLEDAIDREIKSYSHGMKQKIVVIASLIHDPKVWVLDEPLTGLDPTSAYQIKECMREHASRGNIVFFSSHVIEVVEKICTRICIIGHGKLQCEYSLKELKKKGISLEELYLKYVSSQERIR